MNLHLRIDSSNETHTQFTIFEDETNCGQICMTTTGFIDFHMMVSKGCNSLLDNFKSTGKIYTKETHEDEEDELFGYHF